MQYKAGWAPESVRTLYGEKNPSPQKEFELRTVHPVAYTDNTDVWSQVLGLLFYFSVWFNPLTPNDL
jgi:hypothetical protein